MKTATQVVHMLPDIVSENGNLLLNIPVRGDGTMDEDEVKFLEQRAAWMAVNSEYIFGTRPCRFPSDPLRVVWTPWKPAPRWLMDSRTNLPSQTDLRGKEKWTRSATPMRSGPAVSTSSR
jgi:alpha-L-fucosidase